MYRWSLILALFVGCGSAQPSADGSLDAGADSAPNDGDAEDQSDGEDATADLSDLADAVDGTDPDATEDTDVGPGPAYGYVPPPPGEVSPVLQAETWKTHYVEDIQPYWTDPAALGTPAGNYPTYRTMTGAPTAPTTRYPRMIARQIYTYAMGYALTGDVALLGRAAVGVDWLERHALDPAGGCYATLDANGVPDTAAPKTAQDQAYCALGFAAWFFVTRDPDAEQAVLSLRDLLRDPAAYWDEDGGRIRDGLTADLRTEVDVDDDGGWELVAQLDAINAFMLLVQPVLTSPERRVQFLDDLRLLGTAMVEHFHADGTFWGVHNRLGEYGARHADFGHGLKSFWMLLQIDKRLPDHPFKPLLEAEMGPALARAYDAQNGSWAKRPTGATTVEYGSDWWIYAEADQTAATFNLRDHTWTPRLERTWAGWRRDYVDRSRDVREVIPSIDRQGAWVWDWTDDDNAKCNQWKNGFHATEHAVVGYVLGAHLEGTPAVLHFAPVERPDDFLAVPYVFEGREVSRAAGAPIELRAATHTPVAVGFREIW